MILKKYLVPQTVAVYYDVMGGVDRFDQRKERYQTGRSADRWHQYRRPEKGKMSPESSRASPASESAASCDKALNEADDSGRPLDLNDAYGIDCT
ncbi:hypothetical protein TNCV_2550031 [Trichonephila clavipes]|nr:hypothetical protein TNCV_2550031 [Trichonephila clavipes]